jgi:hypothetical protein
MISTILQPQIFAIRIVQRGYPNGSVLIFLGAMDFEDLCLYESCQDTWMPHDRGDVIMASCPNSLGSHNLLTRANVLVYL